MGPVSLASRCRFLWGAHYLLKPVNEIPRTDDHTEMLILFEGQIENLFENVGVAGET